MPDFTVARRGTDSSGRPIYTTAFFWQVWQAVLQRPRVAPFAALVVIVQGGFMTRVPGGGAAASAGYHDGAGTTDIRVWNLSAEQERILWWEFALFAIIFWPRGPAAYMGGMDEHAHCAAGWDRPVSSGIAAQWRDAMPPNRGSGLASGGPDYVQPRPPWVDFPPAELLQEDYMATDEAKAQLEQLQNQVTHLTDLVEAAAGADQKRWTAERQRDRDAAKKARQVAARQVAFLGGLADQLAKIAASKDPDEARSLAGQLHAQTLQQLAADPDIDGPDNPAPDKVPT